MSNVTEPNIGMIVFGVRSSVDTLINAIGKQGFDCLKSDDINDLIEARHKINDIILGAQQETK